MPEEKRPPVCDYEGSDYQTRFWETGGRDYEDRCEAIALKRLLPQTGTLMLELGAGAGRNTTRYQGFDRVVLLDYSRTQLNQAQERLGISNRYIYVAADIYRLPFVDSLFDATTMIRTLHHMADAPAALRQVRNILQPGATFILEYANKRNLKAILRYALRFRSGARFYWIRLSLPHSTLISIPRCVNGFWKRDFKIEKILAVSHFRVGILKRIIPASLLAGLDSLLQWTGALWQVTPSVFIKSRTAGSHIGTPPTDPIAFFKCPECGHAPLVDQGDRLACPSCNRTWKIVDGIYDFRGN